MKKKTHSKAFLRRLKNIQAKRPRTVIAHLLKHGQITTEDLKNLYGYNHPPRAIRDVREHGIPIETFRVTGSDGRKIAAYKFGDPASARADRASGRTAFSQKLKKVLVKAHGARCNIYLEKFPEKDLQIDHRVPFEISGSVGARSEKSSNYMLLCASANRAKSWSCEHCPNWKVKNIKTCRSCYWAFPEKYTHVATKDIRRLDIVWSGKEKTEHDLLKKTAKSARKQLPQYVKEVLKQHLKRVTKT